LKEQVEQLDRRVQELTEELEAIPADSPMDHDNQDGNLDY